MQAITVIAAALILASPAAFASECIVLADGSHIMGEYDRASGNVRISIASGYGIRHIDPADIISIRTVPDIKIAPVAVQPSQAVIPDPVPVIKPKPAEPSLVSDLPPVDQLFKSPIPDESSLRRFSVSRYKIEGMDFPYAIVTGRVGALASRDRDLESSTCIAISDDNVTYEKEPQQNIEIAAEIPPWCKKKDEILDRIEAMPHPILSLILKRPGRGGTPEVVDISQRPAP